MKVFLTQTAEDRLRAIWEHDQLYSESLADNFQRDLDRFIRDAIGANPEIGHVWHAPRAIRRLIFRRRHNIFYALRDDVAFVLFIFDGRMDINQQISEAGCRVGSFNYLGCISVRTALYSLPVLAEERKDALENQY